MAGVDVPVPPYSRPAALAVMLTSLLGQRYVDFRVIVSDARRRDPRTLARPLGDFGRCLAPLLLFV